MTETKVDPREVEPRTLAPGDPIIEFKDVAIAFGDNVVYEHMDLTVRKGETLTIIGGSGQGRACASR